METDRMLPCGTPFSWLYKSERVANMDIKDALFKEIIDEGW